VQLLCSHPRINVNSKDHYLITPLHMAVHSDAKEIVAFLLSRPGIQCFAPDIVSFVVISFFLMTS
jgi:ankyrin repeat protein